MGRGDSRTRKGKIFKGSYGNVRPKSKNEKSAKATGAKAAAGARAAKPKAAPAAKPAKKKAS